MIECFFNSKMGKEKRMRWFVIRARGKVFLRYLYEDGEYVTDSHGRYPRDTYLKSIVAEARELMKYGETEIALENMLENLNEVSIGINKEAAQLRKQALGEAYSSTLSNFLYRCWYPSYESPLYFCNVSLF